MRTSSHFAHSLGYTYRMVDTFSGAFGNIFYLLGNIAFTWVPATFGSITGTAPGAPPPLTFLSQPVTTGDALMYLQQSPTGAYAELYRHWGELVAISIIISIIFLALIIYCGYRIMEIRRHERMRVEAIAHPVAAHDVPRTELRWSRLMEEANSDDERRWRLAILEADIMLNELLDVHGFRGGTMAYKIKQADRAHFRTIYLAWEAHGVRNKIAHEGSAHLLNARETRRVMGLYEQIFREFKVIE